MNHPIKEIYTDGVPVIKGSVRDYEELQFTAQDVNDVETRNLTGTLFVVCPVEVSGRTVARLFCHDPDDEALTAHNGVTVLVDNAENRFKYHAPTAEEITADVINEALAGGLLDPDAFPGAGLVDRVWMQNEDGEFEIATLQKLVSRLDSYFGNALWREPNPDASEFGQVASIAGPRDQTKGGLTRILLMKDGTAVACGSSATSFLSGSPSGDIQARYVRVPFNDGVQRTITALWSGDGNAHCLTEDGVCWAAGRNTNGQLGLGDVTNRIAWTKVQYFIDNGLTVAEVIPVANGSFSGGTYFRLTNGHLYYAGYNQSYQAGDASITQRNTPVRCGTLTSVTQVYSSPGTGSGTTTTTGAIAGGVLYTWGYNGFGQCGVGNLTAYIQTPTSTGNTDVTKFRMGYTSCLLKTDGSLWLTGAYLVGALGDGSGANRTTFQQLAALGTTVLDFAITDGSHQSVAAIISSAGGRHLRTWGWNAYGQLGVGNLTNQTTPQTPSGSWQGSVQRVQFGGGYDSSSVSLYMELTDAVSLLAAGSNINAQLSNGDGDNASVFTMVLGVRGEIIEWTVFGVSNTYGLQVLTDRASLGGGYNGNGQVGVAPINSDYVAVLTDSWIEGLAQVPVNPRIVEISVSLRGRPLENLLLVKKLFKGISVTFPANFVGSGLDAGDAAAATAVFSIYKNGIAVGTITVAAGATVGVFSSPGVLTLNDGDILEIFSPSPRDADLADIAITLISEIVE